MKMTESSEPKLKMEDHLRILATLLRENKAADAIRLIEMVPGLLNSSDESGRRTAHFAAVGGSLSILESAIIIHREQADATDKMGWSPLMIASCAGNVAVVKYLLSLPPRSFKIDVNRASNTGQTALHYLASEKFKEMNYVMFEKGDGINAIGQPGAAPFKKPVNKEHDEIVELLLGHPNIEIDVRNKEGNTPLFLACEESRYLIALRLAAKGADLNLKNSDGKSPLDVVQTTGFLNIVSELIFYKDAKEGRAAHHAAAIGSLSLLQFVIKNDREQTDMTDEMGRSPLMVGSSAGHLEIVRYILSRYEVDVNRTNSNGQTALHYSASKNHKEVTKLLLENGADINAADKSASTALHRAASQGHYQIVEVLLGHPDIQVDACNKHDKTPLFLACEKSMDDIAIMLVAKGADINKRTSDGQLLLDVANPSLRAKLKVVAANMVEEIVKQGAELSKAT